MTLFDWRSAERGLIRDHFPKFSGARSRAWLTIYARSRGLPTMGAAAAMLLETVDLDELSAKCG